MGLSSSQARLLQLTSRMHQIEYNAARVEAMKLQMANESRRVYEDYLEALDQAKVQQKTLTTNGAVTFVDMKAYSDFVGAGFKLVIHGVPSTVDNPDYDPSQPEGPDNQPQIELSYTVCTTADEVATAFQTLFGVDITDGLTDNFNETLTNLINSGHVTILQKDKDTGEFPVAGNEFADNETSVAINTSLQEVTDEVKLRKAEAKYEADMKRIDMKDRRYDSDLAALDNERNAIKQEMETLKTVAKDNVERTFKIFS